MTIPGASRRRGAISSDHDTAIIAPLLHFLDVRRCDALLPAGDGIAETSHVTPDLRPHLDFSFWGCLNLRIVVVLTTLPLDWHCSAILLSRS